MKVGVIGAGTMGAGISQVFAMADGYEVMMCDISEELAANGKKKLEKALGGLVAKGKMDQARMDGILAKITTGLSSRVGDCELIVEAAIEDMRLKKELFTSLQSVCKKDAIFATNTSSLSITELANGLDRTVVGMHFFNPAPVMKLIEVTAGLNTPQETVDRVMAISREIGKTPVQVKEGPGFVVNRILVTLINEGIGIYADGLCSAEDIDLALQLGGNHPMGPLALGDLIGLDVCLAIMEVMHREFGEDKYRPHPLLRKMVRGGLLGRKTGKGFHDYRK